MRPVILIAPLLLAACAGSWPAGSYVQMGADTDAMVLAPAVSDCLAEVVPPKSTVSVTTKSDDLSSVLPDQLVRNGLTIRPDGVPVSYVVAPADPGEFIRVSAPHGICSQYFARVSGTLRSAGPLMVATQ